MRRIYYFENLVQRRGSPAKREFPIISHERLTYESYIKQAYILYTKEKMHKVLLLEKQDGEKMIDPIFRFNYETI